MDALKLVKKTFDHVLTTGRKPAAPKSANMNAKPRLPLVRKMVDVGSTVFNFYLKMALFLFDNFLFPKAVMTPAWDTWSPRENGDRTWTTFHKRIIASAAVHVFLANYFVSPLSTWTGQWIPGYGFGNQKIVELFGFTSKAASNVHRRARSEALYGPRIRISAITFFSAWIAHLAASNYMKHRALQAQTEDERRAAVAKEYRKFTLKVERDQKKPSENAKANLGRVVKMKK
jgi:hypothetical protein